MFPWLLVLTTLTSESSARGVGFTLRARGHEAVARSADHHAAGLGRVTGRRGGEHYWTGVSSRVSGSGGRQRVKEGSAKVGGSKVIAVVQAVVQAVLGRRQRDARAHD